MAGGNQEPTRPAHHSPEFAFTVEQLTGHERKSSDLITLIVGGVAVYDVVIDSGATCNVMGQQTLEMLKLKGINCESHQSARELFAYGGAEPLPTLGIFNADVLLTGNNTGCRADFVEVKGDGRMLLGSETAEIVNLLHIGPFLVNKVDSGGLESCILEKYKALFTGADLLKGHELNSISMSP